MSSSFLGRGMGGAFFPAMTIASWIFALLFLALMVLAIIALIRYLSVPARRPPLAPPQSISPQNAPPSASALTILDERFARGEIESEEYIARKTELRK